MARRRRLKSTNVVWDAHEWQRAWEISLTRIDGAPSVVTTHLAFRDALDMLDCGFARGDAFQFQLGILMLMDCCNEAIEGGDCCQWW